MVKLCDYGCGREAKYPFKNGKWCCENSFTKCPDFIKRANVKKKGRSWEDTLGKVRADERKKENAELIKSNMIGIPPWNKGKTGVYTEETLGQMRCSNKKPLKGKTWEEIYGKEKAKKLKKNQSKRMIKMNKGRDPWNKNKKGCFNEKTIEIMSKKAIERMKSKELRKNLSKKLKMTLEDYQEKYSFFCKIEPMRENKNGEIEVMCKYCGKWFEPDDEQFEQRRRAIEDKNGNMKGYWYCCKEHQYLCSCSIRVDPKTLTKYEKYVRTVGVETEKSIKIFGYEIENIELRGNKFGYHIDHKFSILEGFRNNVDLKIIGHVKNLEIIKAYDNQSKGSGCSISLEKLIQEINKNEQ